MLDVGQFIDLQEELDRDVSAFSSRPFVNWQNLNTTNARVQEHNVNVGGGDGKKNFNVSMNYLEDKGVHPESTSERYSFRANSDFKVGKKLKFGESLQTTFSVSNSHSSGGLFGAAQNAPFLPVFGNGIFGYAPVNR